MEAALRSLKSEVLRRLDFLGQSKMKGEPLREITEDLYDRCMITKSTRDKPSSKEIAKDLKTRTEFQRTVKDVQEHCRNIIDVFETAEVSSKTTAEIKMLLGAHNIYESQFRRSNPSTISIDSGLSCLSIDSISPSPTLKRRLGKQKRNSSALPPYPLLETGVPKISEFVFVKSLHHWVPESSTEAVHFSYSDDVSSNQSLFLYQTDVVESSGHQNKQVQKTITMDNTVGSSECDMESSDINQFDTYLTEFRQQIDDKSGTIVVPYNKSRKITLCTGTTVLKLLANSQTAVQHKVIPSSYTGFQTSDPHLYQALNYRIIPIFSPPNQKKYESQCKEIAVQVDHISAPQSSGICMQYIVYIAELLLYGYLFQNFWILPNQL